MTKRAREQRQRDRELWEPQVRFVEQAMEPDTELLPGGEDWVLEPRTDGREHTPGNEPWVDRLSVRQKPPEPYFPINRAARRAQAKQQRGKR